MKSFLLLLLMSDYQMTFVNKTLTYFIIIIKMNNEDNLLKFGDCILLTTKHGFV